MKRSISIVITTCAILIASMGLSHAATSISVTQNYDLQRALPGEYETDFEGTMPPTGLSADAAITKAADPVTGSNSAHYVGNDGASHGLYSTIATNITSTSKWDIGGRATVVSISTTNKDLQLFSGGYFDGSNLNSIYYWGVAVRKYGASDYRWVVFKYNYPTYTYYETNVACSLSTNYLLRLEYYPANNHVTLHVNGISVYEITSVTNVTNFNTHGIGSVNADNLSNGEFYFDDYRVAKRLLQMVMVNRLASGTYVAAAWDSVNHTTLCFTSSTGTSWTLRQTITGAPTDAMPQSLVLKNGVLYLNVDFEVYAATSQYQTKIYTSTDGITYTLHYSNSDYMIMLSPVFSGNKIAAALWQVPDPAGYTQAIVDFGWYNTDTNAIEVVSRLATYGDYVGDFPSEVMFMRRTNNTLVAFIRWGESPGPNSIRPKTSTDEGATWTDTGQRWLNYAGMVTPVMVDGYLWCIGYYSPLAQTSYSAMWRVSLTDYSIVETLYPFGQFNTGVTGNGSVFAGTSAGTAVVGIGMGPAQFYTVSISGLPVLSSGQSRMMMGLGI